MHYTAILPEEKILVELYIPPPKRMRLLQDTNIVVDESTELSIDKEKMLNPLERKTIKYFGRPGLQELFAKLVDNQKDESFSTFP